MLLRLGKRVRELREATGLSQEAFADKCGLDRTYVGGIERGERNAAVLSLKKLAKGLGVTLSELLEGV